MPRVGTSADRIILSFIALLQLAVSSLLLFIQFIAYGGGFQPISTPFRLFGLVNAFFLFTARPIPRLGSFLWQLVFVTWALVFFVIYPVNLSNPSNQFLSAVCLFMLICLIYLGASTWQEFARRGWSWSAWMGWK